MANELLSQFHETTADLLQTVSLFTQEQFNTIPFEGSWTAAQVTEHIYKAESGIPKLLQGNTKPTERQADEKAAVINGIFLDFTTKLTAPEFIIPSPADVIQDKDSRYEALKVNREEMEKLFATIDLSVTFTDRALPKLGELTGIEWLVFQTAHSTRHIRQLKNIYSKLTDN